MVTTLPEAVPEVVIHGLLEHLPQCDLCGTCAVIVVQDPAGHKCGYCSYHLLAIGPLPPEAMYRWAYDVAKETSLANSPRRRPFGVTLRDTAITPGETNPMATSTCQECGGSGKQEDEPDLDCTACGGSGEIEFKDPNVDGPDDDD